MGGAILVGSVGFALPHRRPVAWSGDAMGLPKIRIVDTRSLAGGPLFGIGWGLGSLFAPPAPSASERILSGFPGGVNRNSPMRPARARQ